MIKVLPGATCAAAANYGIKLVSVGFVIDVGVAAAAAAAATAANILTEITAITVSHISAI